MNIRTQLAYQLHIQLYYQLQKGILLPEILPQPFEYVPCMMADFQNALISRIFGFFFEAVLFTEQL